MKGSQLEENIWSFKPITFKESVIFMIIGVVVANRGA